MRGGRREVVVRGGGDDRRSREVWLIMRTREADSMVGEGGRAQAGGGGGGKGGGGGGARRWVVEEFLVVRRASGERLVCLRSARASRPGLVAIGRFSFEGGVREEREDIGSWEKNVASRIKGVNQRLLHTVPLRPTLLSLCKGSFDQFVGPGEKLAKASLSFLFRCILLPPGHSFCG